MTAHDDRLQQTDLQRTQDQTAQDPAVVARVPGSIPRGGTRSDRVVVWIGWHLGELVGVGVPAVLAVAVHPLWAVPAGLVAAGWIANEIRVARQRGFAGVRGLRGRSHGPEVAGTGQGPDTGEEVRGGVA